MALTARMHLPIPLLVFKWPYLKVHYPSAFYVALLHSVRHNPTKIKEYIGEARKKQADVFAAVN